MAKISKRIQKMTPTVVAGKTYAIDEALAIVKKNATSKFNESVDVAIRLGIDAKKSDQGVRGSTVLPNGTGKTVKVAVFCPPGEKAEAAKAAGMRCVAVAQTFPAEMLAAADLVRSNLESLTLPDLLQAGD